MLDENFIESLIIFIMNVACKLGLHQWDRFDGEDCHQHTEEIQYDTFTIEYYKCYTCGSEKIVWYDYWGIKRVKKLKPKLPK